MINVAVTGCCGNMGSRIIKTILEQDNMTVNLAIEAPNTPMEGKDIGSFLGLDPLGVEVIGAEKLEENLLDKKPDVLVDFTIAKAAEGTILTCAKCGVNVVVGTTGFSEEQLKKFDEAIIKNDIKAIISPNMATGVNVFFNIVGEVARILGSDYDDVIQ